MARITGSLRCGIYCRVSTQQQCQEDKYSLATQEEACRAHAATQGWQVVEHRVVHEVGSAFKLAERDGLASLLEAVDARELDVLVCHDLDRLSRKQTHTAMVGERVETAGARLAFVLSDFEQTATGTFLRQARAFANELEREKFMERTKRGKRGKAKAGRPQGSARPPFGLRYADDPDPATGVVLVAKARYEPDPERAPVVVRMFDQADSGMSLRKIGFALEAAGVLPPYHGRKHGPSEGGMVTSTHWSAATVRSILTNENYIGVGYAFNRTWVEREGKREATKGHTVRVAVDQPAEERVPLPSGTYPVLVDPAVFTRVQERLAGNRRNSQRQDRDPHVGVFRRGHAVCGICGHSLVVDCHGNRYVYRCHPAGRWACAGAPRMRAETLDAKAWPVVARVLQRPELIVERLAAHRAQDPTGPELAAVEQALAGVAKQQAKLANAVALLEDEDASAPLLVQLQALAKTKKAHEAEQTRLLAARAAWEEGDRYLQDALAFTHEVANETRAMGWEERRQALRRFGATLRLWPEGSPHRWTVTLAWPDPRRSDYLHQTMATDQGMDLYWFGPNPDVGLRWESIVDEGGEVLRHTVPAGRQGVAYASI